MPRALGRRAPGSTRPPAAARQRREDTITNAFSNRADRTRVALRRSGADPRRADRARAAGIGGLGDRPDRRCRPDLHGRAPDRDGAGAHGPAPVMNVTLAGGHGKVALRLTRTLCE